MSLDSSRRPVSGSVKGGDDGDKNSDAFSDDGSKGGGGGYSARGGGNGTQVGPRHRGPQEAGEGENPFIVMLPLSPRLELFTRRQYVG
jgi:hypothetical protein